MNHAVLVSCGEKMAFVCRCVNLEGSGDQLLEYGSPISPRPKSPLDVDHASSLERSCMSILPRLSSRRFGETRSTLALHLHKIDAGRLRGTGR